MKLSDPITDEEIERVKRVVNSGAQLGLYRLGEDSEANIGVSLLQKILYEYERLRAYKKTRNQHKRDLKSANDRTERRIKHFAEVSAEDTDTLRPAKEKK